MASSKEGISALGERKTRKHRDEITLTCQEEQVSSYVQGMQLST